MLDMYRLDQVMQDYRDIRHELEVFNNSHSELDSESRDTETSSV